MRGSPPLFSALPPTIRAVLTNAKSPSHHVAKAGGITPENTSTSLIKGWVKSVRHHKNVSFAVLSDGSTHEPLQAVFKGHTLPSDLSIGSSVELHGNLIQSRGVGQHSELLVDRAKVLGTCDADEYPVQKKDLPDHVLREHAHLRFRTTQTQAVMSLRDGLMREFHDWFEANEFVHIHTPILTSSDCEGAGETFALANCGSSPEHASPSEQANTSGSSESTIMGLKTRSPSQPFFPHPVNLTVSSQLHLEAPTHALSRVYTLSPCFRAEPSTTSRHLAEFYMLEGEVGFIETLDELLDVVEAGIKSVLNAVLQGTSPRALRMQSHLTALQSTNLDQMRAATDQDFARITYSEAIDMLRQRHGVHPFDTRPTWGADLTSEQEKWLAGEMGRPVFVTHYPASLKPFYMLPSDPHMDLSEPQATVACFDLLIPNLGELAGGSLREHRLPNLLSSIRRHGLREEDYEWYLELRRFGSIPHGGWGMGWERFVSWVSGVQNVRDVVAFPRWLGHCKY